MKAIFTLVVLLVVVEAGFCRDVPEPNYAGPESFFAAGVGVIVTDNPYKGINTEVHGIPIIMYRTKKLFIYGPMMSYSFFEHDGWEVSGLAKVRFEGYEGGDSRYLWGMDDREWTFELGGALSKTFDFGRITTDFTADILGEHDGHELDLTYSYDFRNAFEISALTVTPSAGVNYRSGRLNDYYYGVRASEAIAGRPEYHPGDSMGLTTGLRLNYTISERLSLMGMISMEWLDDEIRSSPIVDEDHMESLLLGIIYKF